MKTISGKVISNKMKQTVVVEVEYFKSHPLYAKKLRRSQKFHVHDTLGVKVGDKVKIVETKPISRTKQWRVEGKV